jgi:hypothetical protein
MWYMNSFEIVVLLIRGSESNYVSHENQEHAFYQFHKISKPAESGARHKGPC